MSENGRFKVGDMAVIVSGPEAPLAELDNDVPERYHYLLKGSMVRILECHEWPTHSQWGLQYTVEALDDEAWASTVSEPDTQYVYDIHIAPVANVDTTDITEIEKFLDE